MANATLEADPLAAISEENRNQQSVEKIDAIIFIPGLNREYFDQSVDSISRKIVNALDRNTAAADAIYLATDSAEEEYREGIKARKRTVLRKNGDSQVPFVDVYELNYEAELTKRYKDRNPIIQAITLILTLLSNVSIIPHLFCGIGKTRREKLQIVYCMCILTIIIGYVVIVISAATSATWDQLGNMLSAQQTTTATFGSNTNIQPAANSTRAQTPAPQTELSPSPNVSDQPSGFAKPDTPASPQTSTAPKLASKSNQESSKGAEDGLMSFLRNLVLGIWQQINIQKMVSTVMPTQAGIQEKLAAPLDSPQNHAGMTAIYSDIVFLPCALIVTGLGLFTSKQLKQFIKCVAINYTCAIDYLSMAERKRAILGQLSLLVEHVRESHPGYEKIHIISYSFGSLIALDALFPTDGYYRRYNGVESLVTIGCPFDLIRTLWPEYFANRINPDNVKRTWLNLYNPVDVMGSNFRDDGSIGDASVGILFQPGYAEDLLKPENVVLDQNLHIHNLSFPNLILLRGFRVHTCYWDPDDKAEISCFDEIIKRLYPNLWSV